MAVRSNDGKVNVVVELDRFVRVCWPAAPRADGAALTPLLQACEESRRTRANEVFPHGLVSRD